MEIQATVREMLVCKRLGFLMGESFWSQEWASPTDWAKFEQIETNHNLEELISLSPKAQKLEKCKTSAEYRPFQEVGAHSWYKLLKWARNRVSLNPSVVNRSGQFYSLHCFVCFFFFFFLPFSLFPPWMCQFRLFFVTLRRLQILLFPLTSLRFRKSVQSWTG